MKVGKCSGRDSGKVLEMRESVNFASINSFI
jgi:hypothetical protein